MNQSQIKHIENNIHGLIKKTTCNVEVLSHLQQVGVLCQSDYEDVQSKATPLLQSRRFYEILLTRDSYSHLVVALQNTNQSGAVEILENPEPKFQNFGLISFNTNHILEKGRFGTNVHSGTFDGRPVAVKIVKSSDEKVQNDISCLKEHDEHENILRCYFTEYRTPHTVIALEICLISLEDESQMQLLQLDSNYILREVTQGLEFIHEKGIVHRNLQPSNVLLTRLHKVKLSNFAFSIRLDSGNGGNCESDDSKNLEWMAPEILAQTDSSTRLDLTTKSDIFSLGCLCYYVRTSGRHLFGSPNERRFYITKNMPQWQLTDQDSRKHFISKLISSNPEKRPTATEILKSGFNESSKTVSTEKPLLDKKDLYNETLEGKEFEDLPCTKLISIDKNCELKNHGEGNIYKGSFNGREAAVKVFTNQTGQGLQLGLQEYNTLRTLQGHENIVRFYFVERFENEIYIAYELCSISLEHAMLDKDVKVEPKSVLRKCTRGVAFLHENLIVHGNLTPANILLNRRGGVKISNFGSSRRIIKQPKPVCEPLNASGTDKLQIKKTTSEDLSGNTSEEKSENISEDTLKVTAEDLPEDASIVTSEHISENISENTSKVIAEDISSLGQIFYFVVTDGKHLNQDNSQDQCENALQLENAPIEDSMKELITKMVLKPEEQTLETDILSSEVLQPEPTPIENQEENTISGEVNPVKLSQSVGKLGTISGVAEICNISQECLDNLRTNVTAASRTELADTVPGLGSFLGAKRVGQYLRMSFFCVPGDFLGTVSTSSTIYFQPVDWRALRNISKFSCPPISPVENVYFAHYPFSAYPKHIDALKRTVFHFAVEGGYVKAKFLLVLGACTGVEISTGKYLKTALQYVARTKQYFLQSFLERVDSGASINARDIFRKIPVHVETAIGRCESEHVCSDVTGRLRQKMASLSFTFL